MFTLDDTDGDILVQDKLPLKDNGIFFRGMGIGSTIIYNVDIKKFILGNKVNDKNAFLGWVIDYSNQTNLINVLYRGFLFKDPVKFSLTLKPLFILHNLLETFKSATNTIIENMPRIKKLKRLNLKMITREYACILSQYLNSFINTYEIIYGNIEALKLKASIVTSPFYVNDNGIIKLFDMSTNELKIPDLESSGYFLAYFSFVNKNANN